MTAESRLRTLAACLVAAAFCATSAANTIFFDDFNDGDFEDGMPVTWVADEGVLSIVDGNLQIDSSSLGSLARAEAAGVSLADVSVQTLVRSTNGAPGVQLRFTRGAFDSGYYSFLSVDGTTSISISGDNPRDIVTAQTEFRPAEEDVLMQLDAIGNEISLYLWRPDEPFPPEPVLNVVDDTVAGPGTILVGLLAIPPSELSGVFRFVHVADTHISEPGDYDRDGDVDDADYDFWKSHFGATSGTSLQADGNENGVVDAADYTVWRDHLRQGAGSGAAHTSAKPLSATTPEPASLVLFLSGLCAIARIGCRRIV